ncbi:MAG: aminotransferase class IV family protein [Sulfurimonas sp.]
MSKKYLETIKILDQKIYNLTYHQKRVEKTIGEGFLDLGSIIKPPKDKRLLRCRIVYNQKEYTIEYIPYEKREVNTITLVFDDEIEYSRKYADRAAIERLFAQRDGCDEILIVKNGLLTDTSIANIALFDGEKWLTPKTPLLEGTMRAKLLDEKEIVPADIHYKDLQNFKKLALLNAMIDFDIIRKNIEDIIC